MGRERARARVDALNGIGMCHAELGNYQQTVAACTEALAFARETDAPEDGVWDTLGFAHHRLGDHARAITCFQRSLSLARDLRDVNVETEALRNLGDAYRAAGDVPAARVSWQQALAIHEANDQPRDAEMIQQRLRDLVPASGTTERQQQVGASDVADTMCGS